MDTTDIQRYPDNYEVLSTDAALRAEKIACRLRHLIYSSTTIHKGDYLTSAGTDLFSLQAFSIRKDTKLEKGYLIGHYGAIPFIKGGL